MPLTSKDPYTAKETVQIIAIGLKIARRMERGQPTRALERRADAIRERAQARENARAKARRKR